MKELGEYDAGQHQGAADQASQGEGFMQYYPSVKGGAKVRRVAGQSKTAALP